MAIFGSRVLRCSDGHLFISSEAERLLGSIHLGWWRLMRCPVDGSFRICGNVAETKLTPQQIDDLQRLPPVTGTAAGGGAHAHARR